MNGIAKNTDKGRRYAEALSQVRDGADVYDYGVAVTLREIEKHAPEFITITTAKNPPPGNERQPYFGAIATATGEAWLDA